MKNVSYVLWRNQLFLPGMHQEIKETCFYQAEERFPVAGKKVCKESRFQLSEKVISKFKLSAKKIFQKPNCTNQNL